MSPKFKIGDKVKIGDFRDSRVPAYYTNSMNHTIGKVGVIERHATATDGIFGFAYVVKFSDDYSRYYLEDDLIPLDEEMNERRITVNPDGSQSGKFEPKVEPKEQKVPLTWAEEMAQKTYRSIISGDISEDAFFSWFRDQQFLSRMKGYEEGFNEARFGA